MALLPVTHNRWSKPSISISLYAPPRSICLQDYFGLKGNIRLYFSPLQFPTPSNLLHGDICDSFDNLKEYIIEQAKKEGEIFRSGGGNTGKSVRFGCKTKDCKFHFYLKWDKYGYYIHHHNVARDLFVGSVVHNH